MKTKPEVGRDGALRRLRRRAQRQATERMLPRVIRCTICSARSARAGTAQRAVPTGLLNVLISEFGLKIQLLMGKKNRRRNGVFTPPAFS